MLRLRKSSMASCESRAMSSGRAAISTSKNRFERSTISSSSYALLLLILPLGPSISRRDASYTAPSV